MKHTFPCQIAKLHLPIPIWNGKNRSKYSFQTGTKNKSFIHVSDHNKSQQRELQIKYRWGHLKRYYTKEHTSSRFKDKTSLHDYKQKHLKGVNLFIQKPDTKNITNISKQLTRYSKLSLKNKRLRSSLKHYFQNYLCLF